MATPRFLRCGKFQCLVFLVIFLVLLSILRLANMEPNRELVHHHVIGKDHNYCSRVDLPYRSQIVEDLQPFQSMGISRDNLTSLYEAFGKRHGFAWGRFFHIRNNSFYLSFRTDQEEKEYFTNIDRGCGKDCGALDRLGGMMATLMLYSCFVQLPDMDAFLNLHDGTPVFEVDLPIFGFQKKINETGILIPYLDHGLNNLSKFSEQAQQYSWSSKRDTVIWRGASTGGEYKRDNWRDFPRSRLVQKCKNNTKLNCDAAFYYLPQTEPDAKKEMKTELGTKRAVPLMKQMQYKYILSLDGNGACAGRFEKLISGSSLLLKQESPSFEFYYNALKPYEHYVPVQFNMENLEEQIQWAREHEPDAKRIVKAMQNFSTSIHQENVACYVRDLFRDYSKLFTYKLDPIEKLPRAHQIMPDMLHEEWRNRFPKTCSYPIYPCLPSDVISFNKNLWSLGTKTKFGSGKVELCRTQPHLNLHKKLLSFF